MQELTTYQREIARAILDSVLNDRGLTFTVEIARGGGVRELSAQIERLLLTLHVNDGARLLRIAPPGAGETRERIYDVAVSDGRKIGGDGRCKTPVGNTVDVADASYTNSIGDALLMAYWKDPDFDPGQRAFYYVRVIEIPTPRWTAYDAKRFGITMPDEVPMTVTDRAYTSPIWYTP